jgi:hypothetical protein
MTNNIGYTGFLTGEWDEALSVMDAALDQDLDPTERLWILSNELIIRVSRGDDTTAARATLADLAGQFSDPQISSAPLDPIANMAQAEGRLDEARALFMKIGELYSPQMASASYQAARASTWAGDLDSVKASLVTIDATGYHGPVVEARRKTLRADIAALEGDERGATVLYLEAIRAWHELKVTWEEALTGLDMVTTLDPREPEVAPVASATRAIFERLGARPYLARLDAALARQTTPQRDAKAGSAHTLEMTPSQT